MLCIHAHHSCSLRFTLSYQGLLGSSEQCRTLSAQLAGEPVKRKGFTSAHEGSRALLQRLMAEYHPFCCHRSRWNSFMLSFPLVGLRGHQMQCPHNVYTTQLVVIFDQHEKPFFLPTTDTKEACQQFKEHTPQIISFFAFRTHTHLRKEATQKGEHHMSTEDYKAIMRRFYEEVMNQKNLAAIDDFLAPTFVNHSALQLGMPGGGIEEVK